MIREPMGMLYLAAFEAFGFLSKKERRTVCR